MCRIVRNKAAEKARSGGMSPCSTPETGDSQDACSMGPGGEVGGGKGTSVIAHAPPAARSADNAAAISAALAGAGATPYSINGLLGFPAPHIDPNGNFTKGNAPFLNDFIHFIPTTNIIP